MKRAQPGVLAPAPHEAHPPPDNVGERDAVAQFVEEAGRKGHALYPASIFVIAGLNPTIHETAPRDGSPGQARG